MKDSLNKKEQGILKKLILITTSIETIKNELLQLEKNGQKGSSLWQDKMQALKSLLLVEEAQYSKISYKENNNIADYLLEDISFDNLEVQLNSILSLNRDKIIKARIFMKLDVLFEEYKSKNPSNLADQLYQTDYKMTNIVKQDFLNTFLNILNSYIEDAEYLAIRDYLYQVKYALSTIFTSVEKDFIENDFNIGNLFWVSDAYQKRIPFNLRMDSFYNSIDLALLGVLKDNYLNETSYKECVFLQALTRTYLLFSRNIALKNEVIQIFQTILNTIKPTELIFHINKVDFIVSSAIKYIDKDKEMVNVVTLN